MFIVLNVSLYLLGADAWNTPAASADWGPPETSSSVSSTWDAAPSAGILNQ